MKEYFKVNKFSASAAKKLAGGASPYAAFYQLRKEFKTTDAMKLGTIVHAIIEHGGELPASVAVVSPYTAYTTGEAKAFKAWWDGDKDYILKMPKSAKPDDRANLNLKRMVFSDSRDSGAIMTDQATIDKAHAMAKNLMAATDTVNGEHEKAIYTEDSKCLMDFCTEDTVKDWKTTSKTTMAEVLRECFKFGYHIQAAQYLKLSGRKHFELDFVCSSEPHEVFIVKCGDSFLETGREKLDYAKELWDMYKDTPLEEIPSSEETTIEDAFRELSEPVFTVEGEF